MNDPQAPKTLCEHLLSLFSGKLELGQSGDWLRSPHVFSEWGEEFMLEVSVQLPDEEIRKAVAAFYERRGFDVKTSGPAIWMERPGDFERQVVITRGETKMIVSVELM